MIVDTTTGRSAASRHRPLSGRWLLLYSITRYAIVPVLVGCARGWPGCASDAVAFSAVVVCGLTNGHVCTLAMMHSSAAAEPPEATATHPLHQKQLTPPAADVPLDRGTDHLSPGAAALPLDEQALAGFVLAACLKAGTVVGADLAILLTLGGGGGTA
jgi:hypothetical protein